MCLFDSVLIIGLSDEASNTFSLCLAPSFLCASYMIVLNGWALESRGCRTCRPPPMSVARLNPDERECCWIAKSAFASNLLRRCETLLLFAKPQPSARLSGFVENEKNYYKWLR